MAGGKKAFQALEKRLTDLGFEYSHTNASSAYVFTHASHADVAVNPTVGEHVARRLLTRIEKSLGQHERVPKRRAATIKMRRGEERRQLKAEADRLDAERSRLLAERDQLLDGAASHLTNSQVRDLERRVEEIERERRGLEALMTERPAPADNSVKHRAGQR